MLMPKYDRSSITPQDPTRLAEDGSRQVNTLTKSHSVSGVFGRIFSLIVVRTVVCTTFHFLWGKMHTETKIRLPPKITTRVSSGEFSSSESTTIWYRVVASESTIVSSHLPNIMPKSKAELYHDCTRPLMSFVQDGRACKESLARSLLSRGVSSREESLARSLFSQGVSREKSPLARSLSRGVSPLVRSLL